MWTKLMILHPGSTVASITHKLHVFIGGSGVAARHRCDPEASWHWKDDDDEWTCIVITVTELASLPSDLQATHTQHLMSHKQTNKIHKMVGVFEAEK